MKRVAFAILLLLFAAPALGATLQGTIYQDDLTVAQNVLVTIDTQPEQRLLSTDGNYQFDVPPGNYTLRVRYLHEGVNDTMSEKVQVTQDGTFTYDLFLLHDLAEEESLFNDLSGDLTEPPSDPLQTGDGPWPIIILMIFLIIVLVVPVIAIIIYLKRLNAEIEKEDKLIGKVEEDELTLKVLALFKENDGRMTQKELRSKLPYSEAKISLLITELEAKGKLQKIKKGRGNVLVLKK